MKSQRKESLPERVPFTANPTGETSNLFDATDQEHLASGPTAISTWAHREVWTDRMLETLINNRVKGGRWHALFDKVYDERNLIASARKVLDKKGAAGVDKQTVDNFAKEGHNEIPQLQAELRSGKYSPSPVRRTWIPKAGSTELRPLGIPTIRDRVVQTALLHVIEPILDHTFHARSFGFRHGRGCHDALRVVEEKLLAGYVYVVDADLKGYFDTIPKDRLLALVKAKISDGRVIQLIQKYLDQEIMEELRTWTPESGVPQGAVLSPVLANLYLNPLDHHMAATGHEMVRYADDFVILCRSQEEAEAALDLVRQWVLDAGLVLHPDKTHIVDSRTKSFSFLGYSFRGKHVYPRKKSLAKIRARLRELTPRQSGQSLHKTIVKINQVLRGWHRYFRHCYWPVFKGLDSALRRRLRRQLLKRHRNNPHRLRQTDRWPNQFFTDNGLMSLHESHIRFAKSLGY